jgi:hypothetical protein
MGHGHISTKHAPNRGHQTILSAGSVAIPQRLQQANRTNPMLIMKPHRAVKLRIVPAILLSASNFVHYYRRSTSKLTRISKKKLIRTIT